MSSHSDHAVCLPAPVLRAFITQYAGFRATRLPPRTHAGLPSRNVDLIISLGRPIEVIQMPNPAKSPAAFAALVSGLQGAPAVVRQSGDVCGLHVFLTPLGVRALLGVPSAEIASQVVELADIWGRAAGGLIERLAEVHTWQERFAVLDRVFAGALKPVSPPCELSWEWRRLAQTRGCMPIQQLAGELGWSRRHFSERFRAELGVTPKTAARIFRFERACRLIMDERPSLAQVAFECGYHDQAHMTREWNALAGSSPKAWIAGELPILQDYELSGWDDEARERSPS